MALFNNSNSNTSTGSSGLSSSNATSESTTGTAGATIEGESTLEPEIPRLYVNSHDQDEDNKPEVAEEAVVNGENEDEHYEDNRDRNNLRPFSSSSSSLTLSALSKTPFFNNSGGNFIVDDESLRIPREPAYGDDNADGDDDGNEEDIEDGDEYDDDDDLYDQLFDLHDPISRKAALETASALFAQSHQQQQQHQHQLSLHYQSTLRRSNSTTSNKSIGAEDMDEVERSFLRCTKPICSKKQLISCLSSRSTSPGPISPLLSDEDFGCISTATSSTSTSISSSSTTNDGSVPPSLCSNSSTAPSSRRSSDGSHTPRVRFKKGCVITAVNLTWAPTTYDRAPIDVAESLDMHRCKNVEDAEGYAQDDEIVIHCDDEQPHYLNEEQQQHTRGEWQAFAPGIYNASDLPVDLLSRAAPTSSSTSSPSSAAATAMRMLSPPEDSPSSASDCQTSGFSFSRSTVGYPLSRQCFERSLSSSSSSSSSESENEDVIERCRGLRDLHHQLSSGSAALKVPSPSIYRPTARSPIRHSSIVSSTATVETSLGAAARELSDSLDESSRSSSPSLSRTASDDCLSSTPRAGNGSTFMSRRSAAAAAAVAAGQVGDQQHYFTSSIPSCMAARQANFDANGTHDTSPPPPEEQPARKVQRRLERRSSSACSVSRFPVSSDIWESCEALGGF